MHITQHQPYRKYIISGFQIFFISMMLKRIYLLFFVWYDSQTWGILRLDGSWDGFNYCRNCLRICFYGGIFLPATYPLSIFVLLRYHFGKFSACLILVVTQSVTFLKKIFDISKWHGHVTCRNIPPYILWLRQMPHVCYNVKSYKMMIKMGETRGLKYVWYGCTS